MGILMGVQMGIWGKGEYGGKRRSHGCIEQAGFGLGYLCALFGGLVYDCMCYAPLCWMGLDRLTQEDEDMEWNNDCV